MRCLLAVEQLLGDGGVVLGAVGPGGEDQRGELGLVFLPVTVDPAVALLDADQRPGQVVVDEVVALAVHVHALGGHIAGEQDSHRLILQREPLDDLLLLGIGEPAVHEVDLAWLGEPEPLRQGPVQPLEGRDALGEDDRAGRAGGPTPISLSLATSAASLAESSSVICSASSPERGEGRPLGLVRGVLQPVLHRLREGPVRGEERLEQRVREQPPLVRDSRSVVAKPGGGELTEHPLLLGVAGQRTAWDGPRSRHLPPISLVTSGLILVRRI